MKNKLLNKRFSKILVTLCLLLTFVLGSSINVSAEVLSDDKLEFTFLNSSSVPYVSTLDISGLKCDSSVYSVLFNNADDINGSLKGVYLFSDKSFTLQYKTSGISATQWRSSTSTQFIDVYYMFIQLAIDGWVFDSYSENVDYRIFSPLESEDYYFGSMKFLLGINDSLPDGVTIEGGSPIPSNPEYDSAATALIAPPSGVTYYEYVDTSQTSLTSPTVRKGQLQWNVPDDDSLYIEIYADLTYKEGLFNKKTQVVYPWKTLTNSGLKADTHKLLFDRFQAGTDFFVENGLDESAFSSHVVNGYYLRFCKVNDDKSVSYSLWNKISIYRDNSLTQIGTASSETGIFDENGNWVNKQIVNSEIVDGGGKLPAFSPGLDDDGNNLPSNNNGLDLDSLLTDSNIFERFIGYLKSAMTSLGELPQYVGQLFSFLPQEIIGLLGFGVIIAIILRIIGR